VAANCIEKYILSGLGKENNVAVAGLLKSCSTIPIQAVRAWKQQGRALSRAWRTAEPVNLYRRRMQKGFISFLRADGLCLAPPLVVNLWSFVRIAGRQAGASLQCTSARDEPAYLAHVSVGALLSFSLVSSGKKRGREREKEKERERSVTIKLLNNCGRPLDSARLIRLPVGAKLQTSDGWACYRVRLIVSRESKHPCKMRGAPFCQFCLFFSFFFVILGERRLCTTTYVHNSSSVIHTIEHGASYTS